jgi:hypothetical protein
MHLWVWGRTGGTKAFRENLYIVLSGFYPNDEWNLNKVTMHVYATTLPYVSNAWLDIAHFYFERSFAIFEKMETEKLVTWAKHPS